jgi:very-short-patch-repair endonuclease
LEIWGHLHVVTGPDFVHLRRQLAVHIGRRTVYLDLADEATMVAIELDGAAYHDDTLARERDRRRDALLATLGWLTLRFSSRRLRSAAGGRRASSR